jgi:hypothetical protein
MEAGLTDQDWAKKCHTSSAIRGKAARPQKRPLSAAILFLLSVKFIPLSKCRTSSAIRGIGRRPQKRPLLAAILFLLSVKFIPLLYLKIESAAL